MNLGCGHGADFLPFTTNFELYGIDFADEMLRLARKYAAKFNFAVNLTAADICYLPYTDSTFDYIIAVAAHHHLKQAQQLRAFQELATGAETRRGGFYYRLEPFPAAFLVQRERSAGALADQR